MRHGSLSWVPKVIPALRRAGIRRLYHVGDFGIWPDDAAFIDAVEYWADLADLENWVTPGNHDDDDKIDALLASSNGGPAQYSPHVCVLPRGFRWQQANRSFVSLGGAGSIDRDERTDGRRGGRRRL